MSFTIVTYLDFLANLIIYIYFFDPWAENGPTYSQWQLGLHSTPYNISKKHYKVNYPGGAFPPWLLDYRDSFYILYIQVFQKALGRICWNKFFQLLWMYSLKPIIALFLGIVRFLYIYISLKKSLLQKSQNVQKTILTSFIILLNIYYIS